MSKTVLDVGNCQPDHSAIRRMLTKHFDVRVLQCDAWPDTLQMLQSESIDLILVNRKLDTDYSDGIDVLKSIKSDTRFAAIPVMLITNYSEVQQEAVSLGAIPGFGKLSLSSQETLERLSDVLAP